MELSTGKIDYAAARVLITGAHGMVGSALRERLPSTSNIICLSSSNVDLTNRYRTFEMIRFFKPQYVIHLAAKVGGVKANSDFLADFYTKNICMNTNILDACHESGVEKVVSMLSTCVYPDDAEYPLVESAIHDGPPHPSNYAYAYAKRMIDIQSKAYRDQHGDNFVTIVPNNLYGAHDYFDLENSHVIPGMIRKIHEAKLNGTKVTLWGDGSPLREFTYSKDLAEIVLFVLEEYNGREPINVGCTDEYSIKEVAELTASYLEYDEGIEWDTSKPKGQYKKPSSNENFCKVVNDANKTLEYATLADGLKEMCQWFQAAYPNIRGY